MSGEHSSEEERALKLVIEEYVKTANAKRTSERVSQALVRHQNELRLEKMEFFLQVNRKVLNKIE
jgi:phage baseplate assembly protein W